MAMNVARVEPSSAIAPIAGPTMKPSTAKLKTMPSVFPRCSRGVVSVSQARAPDHVTALAIPCVKRAAPSSTAEEPKENASVESASTISPMMTVRFGPIRDARSPEGIPPTTAPAP